LGHYGGEALTKEDLMSITALFGPLSKRTRKTGDLIKRNKRTIWMRLPGVAKAIKRHIVKDEVE
jgi:hypothetical protein